MRPFTLAKAWGSHIPVLLKMTQRTTGPILELGMGLFSTPILHWICFDSQRHLVSYDSEPTYFNSNAQYATDFHEVYLADNWDNIDINKPWDIAFIDLSPPLKRKDMAKKLSLCAKFVILHDTQARVRREYCYDEIYPLFKYRFDYNIAKPWTTVLSNYEDISQGL